MLSRSVVLSSNLGFMPWVKIRLHSLAELGMRCGCTGMTGALVRASLILRRVVLLCTWPFLARLMRSLVSRLSFLPLFHGTDPYQHHICLMSSQRQGIGFEQYCCERLSTSRFTKQCT